MKYGFATPFASSQEALDFDFYKAVKDAGFDFIELPCTLLNNITEDDYKRLVDYLKLLEIESSGVCSLFPGRIKFFDIGGEELEEYIDWIFGQVKPLGAKKIGFGSGGARKLPEGMSQAEGKEIFVEKVQKHIVPYLDKYDYEMVIEAFTPAETNFITSAQEAADMANAIGGGRIGILTDTLHMIGAGDHLKAESIAKELLPVMNHVHISEPERGMPVDVYSAECERCVRAFAAAGYDGTISFETKCNSYGDLAPALNKLKSFF